MAIGYNWAEGSFATSSFTVTAWLSLEIIFTPIAARTHIIAFDDRTQKVE